MENLFGIPMQNIMVVLLVMLGICLLAVAFIAWRRPVIFKMGMRNIPRRKAQTGLIIVVLIPLALRGVKYRAVGAGKAVVQGQERPGLDMIQDLFPIGPCPDRLP